MGSGFSGKYQGTWSSKEGEALRAKVLAAIEEAGGWALGDSAVQLAEALARVALGEDVEEADFPEPGDVAFDLALDALSAFVPGGGQATRTLSLAAKKASKSRGLSKAAQDAINRGIASKHTIEENAEHAAEKFPMTDHGNFGEHGKKKGVRRIAPSNPEKDSKELYERLGRGAEDADIPGHDGWVRRWLADGTCIVHRPETSTPQSPSVEISQSPSERIGNQRIHFMEEKTW